MRSRLRNTAAIAGRSSARPVFLLHDGRQHECFVGGGKRQSGLARSPGILQMTAHAVVSYPQDLEVARAHRELIGIREEESFATPLDGADPLEDLLLLQAGRIVAQRFRAIECRTRLSERPALYERDPIAEGVATNHAIEQYDGRGAGANLVDARPGVSRPVRGCAPRD